MAMRFLEKLAGKQKELYSDNAATVVFFGDSVTQGCFECDIDENGEIDVTHDTASSYSVKFVKLLQTYYPRAQINYINSGISGDGTIRGLARVDQAVVRYKPDLTVISFGLNDCGKGMAGLEGYRTRLGEIFSLVRDCGSDIIFLAPCIMNTYVHRLIPHESLKQIAESCMRNQKEGVLAAYFQAAQEVGSRYGVRFCNCYGKWERMQKAGVDTTALLSNYINHPTRDMHWLLANTLLDTLFES